MGIKNEWTSTFARGSAIDSDTNMPVVQNFTHDHLVSQANALKDSLIACEKKVGSSRTRQPVWNYLDPTLPGTFANQAEALYQFDGTDDSLTDRTGHGHNLTLSTRDTSPYLPRGFYAYTTYGGLTGVSTFYEAEFVAAASSALRITGPLTIEVVLVANSCYYELSNIVRHGIEDQSAWASTSDNLLYGLYHGVSGGGSQGRLYYQSQTGGGAWSGQKYFLSFLPTGLIRYIVLTRNSSGHVFLYQNDDLVDSDVSTVSPTVGTSGVLRIGGWYLHAVLYSVRVTPVEFTPGDIHEVYVGTSGQSNGLRTYYG